MGDPKDATGRLAELGLMTATLSHEIRQPLFAIKSLIQLLQARDGDDPHLAQLAEQATYLECLVDGITSYAREAPTTPVPVDVSGVARQAIRLLVHSARRKGVELRLSPLAVPAACFNPTALMQVLVNLLNNAVDASPASGVVEIRPVEGADYVGLEVRDQGPGVPAADRERIFDRFFTTKELGEGTGLGLALSAEICKARGGRLRLLDGEGGAVFRIEMPALA